MRLFKCCNLNNDSNNNEDDNNNDDDDNNNNNKIQFLSLLEKFQKLVLIEMTTCFQTVRITVCGSHYKISRTGNIIYYCYSFSHLSPGDKMEFI